MYKVYGYIFCDGQHGSNHILCRIGIMINKETIYYGIFRRIFFLFFILAVPCTAFSINEYSSMYGKDSLSTLASIKGADMTFYELFSDNYGKDKDKAVEYASIFLGRMDTSAVHPVIARVACFISDYYEKDVFLFSKAIFWKERALYNFSVLKDDANVAKAEYSLAKLYYKKGQYHRTLEYATEALAYFSDQEESDENFEYKLDCYNLLGAVYFICKDYKKSDYYVRLYVEGSRRSSDKTRMAFALNNSAVFPNSAQDSVKTRNLISEAIELCRQEKDTFLLCKMYLNITACYINSRNMQLAWKFLKDAYPLLKTIEDKGQYYYFEGLLYYLSGQYDEAVASINKSVENYSKGEFDTALQRCYSFLDGVYQIKGDTILAYRALKSYNEVRERLGMEEVFLELFHSQNELIDRREAEKDVRKREALILYSLGIFVLLGIILYMVSYMRKKQKKSKEEMRSKNEILEIKKMQEYQNRMVTDNVIEDLKKLNSEIKETSIRNRISRICSELEGADNDQWNEISQYVPEFNSAFFQRLVADFPDLTVNERRLCALLNLNMSSKEISEITRQSPNSIKIARYRLRTKFNLTGEDTSLQEFLSKYN